MLKLGDPFGRLRHENLFALLGVAIADEQVATGWHLEALPNLARSMRGSCESCCREQNMMYPDPRPKGMAIAGLEVTDVAWRLQVLDTIVMEPGSPRCGGAPGAGHRRWGGAWAHCTARVHRLRDLHLNDSFIHIGSQSLENMILLDCFHCLLLFAWSNKQDVPDD